MPYHPSHRLERMLSALVPPAAREHTLGDLAEFSHTRREYVTWFVAVLPAIVLSEVRRKLRAGTGVGLMAALAALTLAVAAIVTRGRALAAADEWLRWMAPWTVWVTGCAIAAAYGRAGSRLWNGWCLVAALVAGIGTAALAGADVAAAAAAIVVATAAHIAITLPRTATELARLAPVKAPLSLHNLDERAREFQRKIWWRNLYESVAGLVALTANIGDVTSATSAAERAAPLLIIAGVLCVMVLLHTKAGSRRVPDTSDARALLRFHQDELERQRTMLRLVPLWYLLPLAPGMVLSIVVKGRPVSGAVALVVMALLFYGVTRLNRWSARSLDGAVAEAHALENTAATDRT